MVDKETFEIYSKLIDFRQEQFTKLLSKKSNEEDFANACFQYMIQNKIRPIAKAHDKYSILLNYYYWTILIERKVSIERRLIELDLGSETKFRELTDVYVKRRDQMVRRLVWELKEPVKNSYIVFNQTIEILLESGDIIYSSKESLDKVKIFIDLMGKSKIPYYLPILDISIHKNSFKF